ncbi:MAG: M48 family metalloprotease [Thermodesulfobacteriota bacterium]
MLFTQIIAFILVMVVFEAYQPGPPEMSAGEAYLGSAVLLALLWVAARLRVSMFLSRLAGPRPLADPARAARRLSLHLHLAALVCLFAMITFMELKAHLLAIPGVAAWETLRGLVAVGLYLLLLRVVWSSAHRVEQAVGLPLLSRREYLRGQLRLVAPVVFPWFAVSLLRDLVVHAWPPAAAWLDSGLGGLVYLAVFVALLALFFPPLVRSWWGCRPLPPGRERQVTEAVLEHVRVRVGGILSWPLMGGRLLTAGILGLVPRLRYLLITPTLAQALDNQELAGVVAHEAGHVRHRHLWYYLAFFLGFFLLAYALADPLALALAGAVYGLAGSDWGLRLLADQGLRGAMSLLMALPLLVLLVLYLRFVMGFFMRHFERQADFFALTVMGEAGPLVAALEKIASLAGDSRRVPSWHHFSIAQRVEALERAQAQPGLVAGQARLLKKGLMVYLAALALILAAGYGVQALHLDQQVRRATVLRVLQKELQARPHDPRLRLNLGVLLFEQGQEARALEQLRLAARLAPQDPEVLNGLSWLLATAKDRSLRDPRLALELALKAVAISPKPHIWDTLAESYFVNGQPARALAAARAALAARPTDKLDYYQAQLKRFAQAAGKERP